PIQNISSNTALTVPLITSPFPLKKALAAARHWSASGNPVMDKIEGKMYTVLPLLRITEILFSDALLYRLSGKDMMRNGEDERLRKKRDAKLA
ncbi:hypothetical protein AKJ16_DCAP06150, partial [Drosera capensis]